MTAKTKSKTTVNERIAGYLLSYYHGRGDVVLVYGDGTEPKSEQLSRPMIANDIAAKHLTNQEGYGVYPVLDDGTCWFAAFDLDNKVDRPDPEIKDKVKAIHAALGAIDLDHLVCTSQSGRGYHITLYFAAAIPAWLPRRVLAAVLARRGLSGIEIFPKQDRVRAGHVGNAIRLPLFGKSEFIDPTNDFAVRNPLDALKAVKRLTLDDLRRVASRLGVDLNPPAEPATNATLVRPSGAAELPASVKRLLQFANSTLVRRWGGDTAGLSDKSRSGVAMSIACCLARSGIGAQDVSDTLAIWCSSQNWKKSDEWIARTVAKAEELVFQSNTGRRQEFVANIKSKFPGSIARDILSRVKKFR